MAAAAALPPVSFAPALFAAFPLLVWQLDGAAGWRGAAARGWWFGFGHFLAGTFWIANALLVQPDRFAWLIPFATAGLSACLALYPAAACAFARLLRAGWPRVCGLACAWTALEMLRGVAFTGFPWNPIGSVWADYPPMIQSAALVGVFGIGLATAALAAWPALLARGGGAARAALFGPPLVVAALWAGGAARLSGAGSAAVPGVGLAIVQPAIDQRDKIAPGASGRNLARHLAWTARAAPGRVTHVVWPETAIQRPVSRAPAFREAAARAVPVGGYLLAGTVRMTPRGVRPTRVWNSLQVFDSRGEVAAVYDKAHLVPFGEYLPLRWIPGLSGIAAGGLDFSAGPGPRTLAVPGLPPFGALICYEIVFPGAVVDPERRPSWLLNLTNDGWFGDSTGPHQHFAAARLRAVEEGLPVVRAANSGISGVIDAYGRVQARLGLGRAGVLEADLPAPLAGPTPFARAGNLPVAAFVLVCAALLAWRFRAAG